MVAGHSGQFTPCDYLSAVKHTALAGIEPTTFRLLVRRATSCDGGAENAGVENERVECVSWCGRRVKDKCILSSVGVA